MTVFSTKHKSPVPKRKDNTNQADSEKSKAVREGSHPPETA